MYCYSIILCSVIVLNLQWQCKWLHVYTNKILCSYNSSKSAVPAVSEKKKCLYFFNFIVCDSKYIATEIHCGKKA